jgi:hypothetical protein
VIADLVIETEPERATPAMEEVPAAAGRRTSQTAEEADPSATTNQQSLNH